MLSRTKQTLFILTGWAVGTLAHAQDGGGLDLEGKTNTLVATLEGLGLPVLILAICVGVFGYWFKYVTLGFAGAIIIGGIIFGAAPELASFLLA